MALSAGPIQLREEHWVIADLHGKAGHIRTVPIPLWLKEALDRWTEARGIRDGCQFRAINKAGKIWSEGMMPNVLGEIVKRAAEAAGIENWHPMIFAAHVPVSVIWLAASSIRFSFSSVACRSRQRNTTSAANRSSGSL